MGVFVVGVAVGSRVGLCVGSQVGLCVVGSRVGDWVGLFVGPLLLLLLTIARRTIDKVMLETSRIATQHQKTHHLDNNLWLLLVVVSGDGRGGGVLGGSKNASLSIIFIFITSSPSFIPCIFII